MVCNSVMNNMYGNLNTKMIKHLDMKRRDMIQRELSQLIRERGEVRQSVDRMTFLWRNVRHLRSECKFVALLSW